jgi:hypothetical protein
MLDHSKRLVLADCPDLLIYGDHERSRTFYLLPAGPAVEVDDTGRPQARVLLYLKRQDGVRRPAGGQVSLSTLLATSAGDLERVRLAIEASLTLPAASPGRAEPRFAIELLSPEWISGHVTVVLVEGLVLSGQPSLIGDNRCSMTLGLTAEQAAALRDAWTGRLPKGAIVYDMVMRVASTTTAVGAVVTHAAEAGSRESGTRSETLNVEARLTSAATSPVALRGPVWTNGLKDQLTEIDLS